MSTIRPRRARIAASVLALPCAAVALAATAAEDHAPPALADRFDAIAPLVGYEWTIDTKWTDGSALRARNQYRVGLNGQFVVADTYASEAGGDEYHRYHTVYVIDPNTGDLNAHGFSFDGTAAVVAFDIKASDDGDTVLEAITDNPAGQLKQSIELEGAHYTWNVWFRPTGAEEWAPMMVNGVWKRGKKL